MGVNAVGVASVGGWTLRGEYNAFQECDRTGAKNCQHILKRKKEFDDRLHQSVEAVSQDPPTLYHPVVKHNVVSPSPPPHLHFFYIFHFFTCMNLIIIIITMIIIIVFLLSLSLSLSLQFIPFSLCFVLSEIRDVNHFRPHGRRRGFFFFFFCFCLLFFAFFFLFSFCHSRSCPVNVLASVGIAPKKKKWSLSSYLVRMCHSKVEDSIVASMSNIWTLSAGFSSKLAFSDSWDLQFQTTGSGVGVGVLTFSADYFIGLIEISAESLR